LSCEKKMFTALYSVFSNCVISEQSAGFLLNIVWSNVRIIHVLCRINQIAFDFGDIVKRFELP